MTSNAQLPKKPVAVLRKSNNQGGAIQTSCRINPDTAETIKPFGVPTGDRVAALGHLWMRCLSTRCTRWSVLNTQQALQQGAKSEDTYGDITFVGLFICWKASAWNVKLCDTQKRAQFLKRTRQNHACQCRSERQFTSLVDT